MEDKRKWKSKHNEDRDRKRAVRKEGGREEEEGELQKLFEDIDDVLDGEIDASNSIVDWADFYSTINYINTVIENAPGVLDEDETYTQEELDENLQKGS